MHIYILPSRNKTILRFINKMCLQAGTFARNLLMGTFLCIRAEGHSSVERRKLMNVARQAITVHFLNIVWMPPARQISVFLICGLEKLILPPSKDTGYMTVVLRTTRSEKWHSDCHA